MCGGKAVSFILPAVGNGSVSIAIHISLSLFGRQKMYTYVLLLSGPLRIIARLWQKGTKRGGNHFQKLSPLTSAFLVHHRRFLLTVSSGCDQ